MTSAQQRVGRNPGVISLSNPPAVSPPSLMNEDPQGLRYWLCIRPIPFPFPGDHCQCLETFLHVSQEKKCRWHLLLETKGTKHHSWHRPAPPREESARHRETSPDGAEL